MLKLVNIEIAGQHFSLHQDKVVHWHEENALLVSDIHAGKAELFRQHGIPLSSDHLLQDLNNLNASIKRLNAKKIYILGDLFHSDHNDENRLVESWINPLNIDHLLIEGNHDQHSSGHYDINSIDQIEVNGIYLNHEPIDQDVAQIYGHLHPAFVIKGKARQHLRMPCYHYSKQHLCLPAFGQLTGSKVIKKKRGDQVVMIGAGQLIPA